VLLRKKCVLGAYHEEVSGEEIVQKKYNMQIFSTIIALRCMLLTKYAMIMPLYLQDLV
jgi:hypothetical protein